MLAATYLKLLGKFEQGVGKLKGDLASSIGVGYETGGGWHDNALFESSLMDQKVLAHNLAELSELLNRPIFIDDLEIDGDTVSIGTEIVIERTNGEGAKQEHYLVLGPADARVRDDVLPYTSPLFKAIMGKRAGDQVAAEFPGGMATVRIISVRPLADLRAP